MKLSIENQGSDDLLLLHGWGMHSGMWGDLSFPHARVDLPGHGLSAWDDSFAGLDDWVDCLAAQVVKPVDLCGWSLGGLLALRWAEKYPDQVRSLVLVTSTPCFVQQVGWDCAMAASVLAGFAEALQQNYLATLKRFLSLQLRGGAEERALLLAMRDLLVSRGEPSQKALVQGLEILRDTDLRGILPSIRQRTLVIAGEKDTLTPAGASEFMGQQLPNAELVVVKGASHVPFLSHQLEFERLLMGFVGKAWEK